MKSASIIGRYPELHVYGEFVTPCRRGQGRQAMPNQNELCTIEQGVHAAILSRLVVRKLISALLPKESVSNLKRKTKNALP